MFFFDLLKDLFKQLSSDLRLSLPLLLLAAWLVFRGGLSGLEALIFTLAALLINIAALANKLKRPLKPTAGSGRTGDHSPRPTRF